MYMYISIVLNGDPCTDPRLLGLQHQGIVKSGPAVHPGASKKTPKPKPNVLESKPPNPELHQRILDLQAAKSLATKQGPTSIHCHATSPCHILFMIEILHDFRYQHHRNSRIVICMYTYVDR